LRIALIGQPNCGKSTLFNQVAGYKAETGNFTGTTVTYTESKVRVAGEVVEIVDLPGAYTLEAHSPAEQEAASYLRSNEVDVIVNVVDASHMALGLELTLELLPLNKPLIVALNMMDEADRLGLHIDGPGLQKELGTPVLPLVASKGRGVKGLFLKTLEVGKNGSNGEHVQGAASVGINYKKVGKSGERHGQARMLASKFVEQGEHRVSRRDRLDDVLLHPILGYVFLLFILYLFFQAVYGIGQLIEPPLLALFETLTQDALVPFGAQGLLSEIVKGVMQGVAAGSAIVLPYLLPFLFGLGIL
jgi:ferrous iron transport protein B